MQDRNALQSGLAALIPVLGLMTAACAGTVPPVHLHSWESVSPVRDCPYRKVFVDFSFDEPEKDKLYPGWPDAEQERQSMLTVLASNLHRAGWQRVHSREEAAFAVRAIGQRMQGSANHKAVALELAPTMKTNHHAYVASLGDSAFPLRNQGFGTSHTIVIYGPYTDKAMDIQLDLMLQASQINSLPTAAALCETRARLTDEGTSLEELRQELVGEMERVRQNRRQQKKLRLETD